MPRTLSGSSVWASNRVPFCPSSSTTGEVGLDDVERPRPPAPRRGVDQNRQIVAVEERVREIKPANAKVDGADAVRPGAEFQPTGDLASEGVITQKDVADAGDQDRW